MQIFSNPLCYVASPLCDGDQCRVHACTIAHPIIFSATATLKATVAGTIQKIDTLDTVRCEDPKILNKGTEMSVACHCPGQQSYFTGHYVIHYLARPKNLITE